MSEIETLRRQLEAEKAHVKHLEDDIHDLQKALAYWMPGISEEIEIETNGRAGDDACLLYGYMGELEESYWDAKARKEAADISADVLMERERCAKIAEEIAYIEGTDFGSVNAIRYGWPEIDQCQHGKSTGEECSDCPPEARQKWWEVAARQEVAP